MKKSLSLIVALAMVFTLLTPAMAFAATSAERSAGAQLEELGILKGDGNGELYLDNELNRQDMIVLLSRLLGVEEEAAAHENTHGWDDVTDPYYNGFISWAKEEGLTLGVGDGETFGYNGALSIQQLLQFMLRALEYEVEWNDVPEVAIELGLATEDTDFEATATRGSMAVVTLDTLNTPVNGSNQTLGAKLELPGFGPEFPETLASVLNLIQVEVVLEDGFNADEAKKTGNYEFDKLKVDNVNLEGNVAVLTLEKAAANRSDETLVINSNVTGTKQEFDLRFVDTVVPEVEDAYVIGKNTVKVVFSEPINFNETLSGVVTSSNIKREFKATQGNRNFLVNEVNVVKNGTEANVKFYSSFAEGTLNFEVGTGLEDYAGFSVVSDAFEIEVVKDETAPSVVDYKNASRSGVTIVFDEDVEKVGKDEDFYHTNRNNKAEQVEVDGNEVKLTFGKDNYLPEGIAYVYIDAGAVADYWDNENEFVRLQIEIDEDTAGPVVEEIDVNADRIIISFNEALDEDSAKKRDNYTLLDRNGDEVENKLANPRFSANKNDEITINFRGSLEAGDYTIVIENVRDISLNRMSSYSEDFTVDDNQPPSVDNVYGERLSAGEYRIIVNFSEAMATDGRYSVLDLDNYALKGKLLSHDDYNVDVSIVDEDETVEFIVEGVNLTLGTTTTTPPVTGDDLTIYRVADKAGNLLANASVAVEIKSIDSMSIRVTEVIATGKDTLKVKFSDVIDNLDRSDFRLVTVSGATYEPVPGTVFASFDQVAPREVIIELTEAAKLNTDVTIGSDTVYFQVVDNAKTENRYARKLEGSTITIKDEIAPEIASVKIVGTPTATESVIDVVFSEVIQNTINKATFRVNGETVESATLGTDGKTVTIIVNFEVFEDDLLTQEAPIYDDAGNVVTGIEKDIKN